MKMFYQFAERLSTQIADWLETHWVTPAFAGWLLGGLALFYFAAGTNTMAGWLYAISGISLAILGIAMTLPIRTLRPLQVHRRPIEPVSVGDQLTIEIDIENPTEKTKTLLQVYDIFPYVLGQPKPVAVEAIPPQGIHHLVYYHPTQRRGVYRWDEIHLRTAAPLGLFWCRRSRQAKATAIVYPTVFPLKVCPLVDEMGKEDSAQLYSDRRQQMGTEGITRTLRPYRFGDPIRLIHWRTSARYGEMRVRELEVSTGGQQIVISLDSAGTWQQADFEAAVIAAASLYFYASRAGLNASLWTAQTGLIQGHQVVLETLAATSAGEDPLPNGLPEMPLIWLTQNSVSLSSLPPGSRWVLWPAASSLPQEENTIIKRDRPGIEIRPDRALDLQLQEPLSRF